MYKTMSESAPDVPTQYEGNFCCGKNIPLDYDIVESKLKYAESVVESLQQEVNLEDNEDDNTMMRRKNKFTGKGFVVLKSQNLAYDVAARSQMSCLRWTGKNFCPFCCNKRDLWEIERATEPSDVYWENMQIGALDRLCRWVFSTFIAFLFIGCTFAIISIAK